MPVRPPDGQVFRDAPEELHDAAHGIPKICGQWIVEKAITINGLEDLSLPYIYKWERHEILMIAKVI